MALHKEDIDQAFSFQHGNEKAFDFFYQKHLPSLQYYAFRILYDQGLAQDMVDEAFIRIWKRYEKFNHPKVIRSWLYTTTRNLCLNSINQQKILAEIKERVIIENPDLYTEDAVDSMIMHDEVIAGAKSVLEKLPAKCKRIFKLLYIEGQTVRTIAEDLDLTISTVKNQKARGLGLIRRFLFKKGIIEKSQIAGLEIGVGSKHKSIAAGATTNITASPDNKSTQKGSIKQLISRIYELRNLGKSDDQIAKEIGMNNAAAVDQFYRKYEKRFGNGNKQIPVEINTKTQSAQVPDIIIEQPIAMPIIVPVADSQQSEPQKKIKKQKRLHFEYKRFSNYIESIVAGVYNEELTRNIIATNAKLLTDQYAIIIQAYLNSSNRKQFVDFIRQKGINYRTDSRLGKCLTDFEEIIKFNASFVSLNQNDLYELRKYIQSLSISEKMAIKMAVNGENVLSISEQTGISYRNISKKFRRIGNRIYKVYPIPVLQCGNKWTKNPTSFFKACLKFEMHGVSAIIMEEIYNKENLTGKPDAASQKKSEKIAIVIEMKQKGFSFGKISKEIGYSQDTIRSWYNKAVQSTA
jgi:RNA polymerase sigma-70 factor (family 1)